MQTRANLSAYAAVILKIVHVLCSHYREEQVGRAGGAWGHSILLECLLKLANLLNYSLFTASNVKILWFALPFRALPLTSEPSVCPSVCLPSPQPPLSLSLRRLSDFNLLFSPCSFPFFISRNLFLATLLDGYHPFACVVSMLGTNQKRAIRAGYAISCVSATDATSLPSSKVAALAR